MFQLGLNSESRSTSYKKYDIHEGIIFLIELSDGMFQELEELNSEIQIIEILNTLLKLMSQLVVTRPGTGIGCYFYNCFKEEANENGIYEYLPLVDINAKNMKQLSDLLEDLANERTTLQEFLPFKSNKRTALENVLEMVKEEFTKETPGQKNFNNKKVFLFTDNDSPPESSDPEAKSRLSHLINDLDDYYIGFTTFFIGSEERPFDNAFYSEVLRLGANSDTEFDGPNTQPISATYIKARVLRKQEIKRILFQCRLVLEEKADFVVGIKGYSIVSHEKPGVKYKLVYENEDVREEAFSKRKFLNLNTGEEIKEGLTKVFPYGDINISLSDNELAAITKDYAGEDSFLNVIGFRSTNRCIHYFNNIEKAAFVVPDETSYEGSIRTLTSLFKCLREKEKSAVVWGKTKTNSNPSMFILSPSDQTSRNEGFYMYRIPFLEELRKFPYVTTVNFDATTEYDQLKELTKNIISYFNLRNGYEPSEFKNPSLQKHFKILHDYLLQIEEEGQPSSPDKERKKILSEDDTIRKISEIRDKILESEASGELQKQKLRSYLSSWNDIYGRISDAEKGDKSNTKKARQ